MARDTYTVNQAGAVGPHSKAENTNFIGNAGEVLSDVDLRVLVTELASLRERMLPEAKDAARLHSLTALAEAEEAAKSGDKSALLSKLKAAGDWALDVATKIGVTVAAKAIEVAIGYH